MEFKGIFVIAILIGIFAFSIISFGVLVGQENNATVNINQNPFISKMFGNVTVQLNNSKSQSEASSQAYMQESSQNPISTALGFVFNSILAAGNTFMSMGIGFFYAVFIFAQEIFGINPIITGAIMSIVVGVLVLAIWSVIRAGR